MPDATGPRRPFRRLLLSLLCLAVALAAHVSVQLATDPAPQPIVRQLPHGYRIKTYDVGTKTGVWELKHSKLTTQTVPVKWPAFAAWLGLPPPTRDIEETETIEIARALLRNGDFVRLLPVTKDTETLIGDYQRQLIGDYRRHPNCLLEMRLATGQVYIQGVPRKPEVAVAILDHIAKLDRGQPVIILLKPPISARFVETWVAWVVQRFEQIAFLEQGLNVKSLDDEVRRKLETTGEPPFDDDIPWVPPPPESPQPAVVP